MARTHITLWIGSGYTFWQKALAWFTARVHR